MIALALLASGAMLIFASVAVARADRDRRAARLRHRRAQMIELHLRRTAEWHRRAKGLS